MATSRCSHSSRDLFIFILCVASLSVLFNFQISYYGSKTFVDQRQPLDEVLRGQLVREQSGRYDVKIFGRSLNQHEADLLKSRSAERIELLTKLNELEKRLLKVNHHVVAVKDDGAETSGNGLISGLGQLDIKKIEKNDKALSWIDNDTVVQGNWSVLFCFDRKCPTIQTDISQKIDRIPALMAVIQSPKIMCSINKKIEKDNGQCEPFKCSSQLNESTVVITGNTIHFNKSSKVLCQRQVGTLSAPESYIWYLPGRTMLFPHGQVLRLHSIITSVSPLRFFVHPEMLTGSLQALEHPSLFKKLSIEDLLQYISEVYGLGVSSRWWTEVQRKLLLYLIHLEDEILKYNNVYKTCKRCFQSLSISIVCPSVQHCQIIQIVNDQNMNPGIMASTFKLVTSQIQVSEEIERTLKQSSIEVCESTSFDEQEQDSQLDCVSEDYLMYLLDSRREIKSASEFIPIYPSVLGCKELSRGDPLTVVKSDTVNLNAITRTLGEIFLWADKPSTESQYLLDEVNDDYIDMRLTKHGRNIGDLAVPCSNDPQDCGKIDEIVIYPSAVLDEVSTSYYNATVGYNTILVRIMGVSKSCKCQVRLENKYNDPGARNITLGLGDNKIMLYVVDTTGTDMNIVNTVTINIRRQHRGITEQHYNEKMMKMCGLKQDCSLKFNNEEKCGLIDLKSPWLSNNRKSLSQRRCSSGDHEAQWVVPCRSCSNDKECFWENARWEPRDCQYEQLSASRLKQCLAGKKLLFIGDSTNRGVSNYIIEQINGSLYDWDKTHSTRVYSNINHDRTQFTFAYYPHFWLPADHRPRFSKVIYQLIKSSLPLENNSNTVLVVGGVQWLAKQHIDLIVEALQRKGLSGITKAVKGLGAGFHQPVENVRYVPKSEHVQLQQRETDVLNYAKSKGFHAVSTFNMTISRYKDFLEGNCACHFHKVNKHGSMREGFHYTVEGNLNAVYSQILLNQICHVP
ncbi:cadherin-like and PC-esterase domain-containing protein 1 [Ruditapes philippinarum]|uniref:cadherin-like and PC-esterase domain-containing protein 1 n=1 Tax=Ruditapes philippinarum TaxID=129788 RepID=UPI00295B4865|nr:cadherin-like and PC-esterase domain-containing protein 1 [Ruditapes philippinarum]XP_060593704.1 cadherin-like and PC-esterase domain-containing protein 1 [Ruditapes philippinarum]XP_060593705.1 cadherin-like and PC-esterase domain-containing protein 1 [Ruditapes philippinarum]XP_060593706.1 cadherin-like and PC-esterase domain-containing protein 1 [Ruditapes philippinarum]XP_060593707.1 cadherin-like and PC-esterase domain-containing protein 1 [Ruditapes philippinarum]